MQHLQEAVRLDEGSVDAWRVLGLARQQLDDHDGAITALRRAAELAPDDESLVTALVTVLQEAGEWGEIYSATRKATRSFPRNARLWLALGQAANRQRDRSTSLEALERVLQLDPANRNGFARQAAASLAAQYMALERYGEAERRARQWAGWEPGSAVAKSILGTALQQRGLTSEALRSHLAAQELQPSRPDYAYNAGTAHLELGELRRAASQFNRAVSLEPTHTRAADGIDSIMLRLRNANAQLGMRLKDATNGESGALVANVDRRTLAAKANLKPGDFIRRFDGRPIQSAEEFGFALAETTAAEVTLELVRGRKRKQTVLRLR